MSALAVGTIVAGNYLAFARVLAASFRRFHPEVPFYVLVLDEPAPEGEEFRVVRPAELGLGELGQILFGYGRKGAAAALKPALLLHLLKQGYEAALFLDPDMLVMGEMGDVLETVKAHALTLTPHLGAGAESGEREARERQILLTGTCNGGFVGASRREETLQFLQWWLGRTATHCVDDLPAGLHYDQRWLDLAAGYVGDLWLLRDAGVNAAYWNLPDARVEWEGETPRVEGRACRLFHFSGFDAGNPERAASYVPEVTAASLGVGRLFARYAEMLREAGHGEWSGREWPWDRYANGDEVTAGERRMYLRLEAGVRAGFGDPFATGAGSFHAWARRPGRRLKRAAEGPLDFAFRAARYVVRWWRNRSFSP